MTSIEERLMKLESTLGDNQQPGMDSEALLDFQAQLLTKLKGIRLALTSEGGDVVQIRDEREKLAAENLLLKKQIVKQDYRIQHLVKAIDREEKKHAE